jgi:hypothetical protein
MTKQTTRDLLLWIGVLAGPMLWLFSFEAKLYWNTWTCASQTKVALFLVALVAFLLTAGAGLLAWRQWNELGKQSPGEAGNALERSRLMALGGLVFSAGFCMVIVAQAIPDMLLEVCQ